jgi:hypothetical protein
MIPFGSYLRLEEVTEALRELGGEAEWRDIEAFVTKTRGRSYAPYKDWDNFNKTMFQLVQQHCQGYQKFTGPVVFEKVRIGRFRLAQPTQPPGVIPTSPVSTHSYEDVVADAATFHPGGEGQDHRRLKEFIAANPQIVGLPAGLKAMLEYPLPSGDCVDVLFQNGDAWIAVEVKGRHSPEADVARGIFQCIKYQAVVEAYQTSQELPPDARAILVLEAPLPARLVPLKDLLDVEVLDHVKPADG